MSLALIDLEMESDPSDPVGTREKAVEAENTDQPSDKLNRSHSSEPTETPRNPRKKAKCKTYAVKTKDSKKTKAEKNAKDAVKTRDAVKAKTEKATYTKKEKDAKKEKGAKKDNERDTEKVVQSEKWGTLRRIVHALGLRASGTSISPPNSDDFGCDDISFDGHLFEYATHPPVIPKVDVPRLHLRPTLRERLYNIAHNFFRCGSIKHHNQYTLD